MSGRHTRLIVFAVLATVVLSAPVDAQQVHAALLARAEQGGDAEEQYAIGFAYLNGRGGLPQDYAEAARWYRLAAEQGHAVAQYGLGMMYSNGVGVPEDDVEAVRWYRLAAEQGYAGAQASLGFHYATGDGVPQDYVQTHQSAVESSFPATSSAVGASSTLSAQESWVAWTNGREDQFDHATGETKEEIQPFTPLAGFEDYSACMAFVDDWYVEIERTMRSISVSMGWPPDVVSISTGVGHIKGVVTHLTPDKAPRVQTTSSITTSSITCFPGSLDPRGTLANRTVENQPAGELLPPSTSQSLPGMSPELMRQLLLLQMLGR